MTSDPLTPPSPGRRSAMRQQRVKDTEPEMLLRRALTARGLRYRLHRRLLKDSRRTTDIAFGPARVAVDVRGCFWHGCPEHCRRGSANSEWWNAKLEANIARDEDTERRLTEAGWLVLVVWEHDDPKLAADRVAAAVRARTLAAASSPNPEKELEKWRRLWGS
ncbi:DNA mismatch endonuclease Vsr [Nocardioides mangrovi]|uniref:Very short patch repair endonuclease n=1 Tax=Nocardioides mangrovi TaxID=2874580 RepID=A0ABS7U9I6_9ACTN|nr:DNA mismatch endonuclease Vsr [Nocardioides mangrovi]MBZ5737519.1 very short patch repair endonuclease [Nocardioides mangrovi]